MEKVEIQNSPLSIVRAASLALLGGLLTGLVIWETQIALSVVFNPTFIAVHNLKEFYTFAYHLLIFLVGGVLGLVTLGLSWGALRRARDASGRETWAALCGVVGYGALIGHTYTMTLVQKVTGWGYYQLVDDRTIIVIGSIIFWYGLGIIGLRLGVAHRRAPRALSLVAGAVVLVILAAGVNWYTWFSTYIIISPARVAAVGLTVAGVLGVVWRLLRWAQSRGRLVLVMGGGTLLAIAGVVAGLLVLNRPFIDTLFKDVDVRLPTQANLLVINIDTLRADALGAYGGQGPVSPSIDALAQESYLFEEVVSAANHTRPSVVSLLTSRYPHNHQWGLTLTYFPKQEAKVDPSTATWQGFMRRAGYVTLAVSANDVCDYAFSPEQEFTYRRKPIPVPVRSFLMDSVRAYVTLHTPTAWSLYDVAEIRWYVRLFLHRYQEAPWFLYVQPADPHSPYNPPKLLRLKFPSNHSIHRHKKREDYRSSTALLEEVLKRYKAEINSVDRFVGDVVRWLKGLNLYDKTWVIVTSDHGEQFNEHGEVGHGYSLYEEEVHIPLIIKPPWALREPVRIAEPVSNVDIMPTLLEAFGLLDVEVAQQLDGRSFLSVLRNPTLAHSLLDWPVFSESFRDAKKPDGTVDYERQEIAVYQANRKLLVKYDSETPQMYLFDLKADSGERINLLTDGREPDSDLIAALKDFTARSRAKKAIRARQPTTHPKEVLDKLKALGYIN